jgi:gliding motility-associated-like protein
VPNASIAAPGQLTCTTTTLTLNGSSTTPGVSYVWIGSGIVSGGNTATPVVNAAGIYTMTVIDAGCTGTATVSVTSNTANPNVSIASPAIVNCTTTTVTLIGASTTPGVTFQWTSGPAAANYTVTAGGTYTLTVTDPSNGCTSNATTTVISNTTPPNVSIAAPAQLTCITSSVTLAGSSTTAGATFQWTSGPATSNYTVTTAGIYTLTATDPSNGCTSVATATVASNTTAPGASIAPPATLTCITTTVTLTGSSSAGGATFQWTSGPATANYPVTAAGIYTLTTTDPSNGCTSVAATTVASNTTIPDVSIAPPPGLTCTTATVTLNGSSTTAGATFQWTSGPATANYAVTAGGTYTLTVTDPSSGCISMTTTTVASSIVLPDVNIAAPGTLTCATTTVTLTGSSTTPGVTFQWTSGPATANYTVTTAGVYSLTVTDPSNSCTNTVTVNVLSNTSAPDLSIAPPAALTCVTLSSTLTGSSSVSGLTYQWTSGPASANYTVTASGTYTLTATDPANGCTNTATATVASNTTPPDAAITPVSPLNLDCNTSSIPLTGSSSVTGALFQWTSGPATAVYTVTAAGIYTLTVTDPVNGCTSTLTSTITSTIAYPNVSIAPPDTITCSNTFATLTGSSATPGTISYAWTPGPVNTPVDIVTTAGTYTLTVTDLSNNCSSSAMVDVIASTTPPDISIAPPAQLNCTNLSSTLAGSSSTPAASFQWAGGPATASYTVTTAGTYTLTVTDISNDCISTATTAVTSNVNIPNLSIAAPQVITCATATIILSGTSPVSGLNYQWISGPAGANYPVSSAGTYTLTASNPANGCSNTASVTVTSNTTAPDATFAAGRVTGCAPVCVSLLPTMAVSPAWQYTWTFSNGVSINGYSGDTCFAEPGVYDASLSVSDPTNGCSASYSVAAVAEAYVVPDAAFSYNPMNPTTSEPTVVFTNESIAADNYLWVFGGDSTSTLMNPVWSFDLEGEHPVVLYAMNNFGCIDSVWTTIIVEGEFAVYVPNAFTPSGDVLNETWRPVGVGVDETTYECSVFDRWGTRIFHTTDWEHGAWDGRLNGNLVQIDTYIYKIKVSPKNKNGVDGPKELNGQVHVIR